MSSNAYRFLTHWQVESTLEEVNAILSNAPDLPLPNFIRWMYRPTA